MQGRRGSNQSTPSSRRLLFSAEKAVFEDGEIEQFSLSDAGLSALGDGFPKLEKLSLIWCSNVSSLGLMSLAYKCFFLKSLDLQVIIYLQIVLTFLVMKFLEVFCMVYSLSLCLIPHY